MGTTINAAGVSTAEKRACLTLSCAHLERSEFLGLDGGGGAHRFERPLSGDTAMTGQNVLFLALCALLARWWIVSSSSRSKAVKVPMGWTSKKFGVVAYPVVSLSN